ncbi:MAG TPA: hypothetical protein VN607_08385 [Gemmatimonadaceae bacterium]|nr:hypothetical protein [Gemmatimonadaceae bacterium]
MGANLGDRTGAWLYDRLTDANISAPGMGVVTRDCRRAAIGDALAQRPRGAL